MFHTSSTSWRDAWLLDTCATYHMIFKEFFFEDFSDDFDGTMYFVDISSFKPLGPNTIRVKLPRLSNFLLHDVFYLPKL